jgi:glyoxylase-like metal-dependent hydrolase (beta-lactamase superfamily II)
MSSMLIHDPEKERDFTTYGAPESIHADILMVAIFSNTYVVRVKNDADDRFDLLLVDPGLPNMGTMVVEAVREWLGAEAFDSARLNTVVYTHHHVDHVCGLQAWIDAGKRPERIVAQRNVAKHFKRYDEMHGWNACINQRQFALEEPFFPRAEAFVWPDVEYDERLTLRVGGTLDVHLTACKGETDDASVIHVPALGAVFVGDLVIGRAPNCGNPQKVQRYPREWADALEMIASLDAELLAPGHAFAVAGKHAIRSMLLNTAQWLRVIVTRTLDLMNEGVAPARIVELVEPDAKLSSLPYLRADYDHPKFIVRNMLRLFGGWWSGEEEALLPASQSELASEVIELGGGIDRVVERALDLLSTKRTKLAAHLISLATRAQPSHEGAQRAKARIYETRMNEETSLMAKGVYRAAANDALRVLNEPLIASQNLEIKSKL